MADKYISIAQMIISVAVVVLILLQERSSGLSGLFGGGESGVYQTRRGLERLMFWATVALVFIFGALALLNLVI